MHNAHRQQGMTAIGLLITFVILATAVTIGMRLVPVYMESFNVSSAVSKLESEARFERMSRRELQEALFRQFSIDGINSVERSDVDFSDVSGGLEVVVAYERRIHLIGNLDAVASFRKTALVRN